MASSIETARQRNKYFLMLFLVGAPVSLVGFPVFFGLTGIDYGKPGMALTWAVVFSVVFFFLWVSSLIAGMALKKGRSWGVFFVLSILFPFITWVIAASLSTDQSAVRVPVKVCPRCAEDVKVEATLCKHCGTELS